MIDDKMGIMDIKAVFNEFEQVDIEMQVVEQADIARRILFYLSKMYAKQIKAGTDYALAKRTIAILITDYAIKEIKEVPKYATKWNFREEDYPKIVLTDAMEICIIELAKLSKYAKKTNNKNLELWLEFIKNPGVKIVMNKNDNESLKETKEAIQAAKEHYEELKKDKHEMELAELREKYIMDQKSISKAGYDRGYDAGYDKGETSGYDKAKIETAKELLKQGVESKIIAKATGLTEKDLEKLL